MPHDQDDDLEMQMFTALGKHERIHGKTANEALLKKFGVTRATDMKPEDFEKVIRACSAADEAPRRVQPRHNGAVRNRRDDDDATPLQRESKARKPSAIEAVINSQEDIKAGFSMAAKAVHARRPKS